MLRTVSARNPSSADIFMAYPFYGSLPSTIFLWPAGEIGSRELDGIGAHAPTTY